MKKHIPYLLIAFCFLVLTCKASASEVPNTLPQAFAALDQQLGPAQKTAFKSAQELEAVTNMHMSLGLYIRNEWFRSGKSKLVVQLRGLGARSLDDVSSVVLTSYWRYINGRPLGVEAQCACYAAWWQERLRPQPNVEPMVADPPWLPNFSCPRG